MAPCPESLLCGNSFLECFSLSLKVSFPLFYLFPPPLSFYLFLFLLFLHLLFFLRILHLSHPSFLHSMIFSYKIQNIKPVNSIRDVCSLPSCSPFFLKSKSFSRSVMSNSFVTPWTVASQSPLSMVFPRQEY